MLKYCDMVGGGVGSLEKWGMMGEVWLDGISLVQWEVCYDGRSLV